MPDSHPTDSEAREIVLGKYPDAKCVSQRRYGNAGYKIFAIREEISNRPTSLSVLYQTEAEAWLDAALRIVKREERTKAAMGNAFQFRPKQKATRARVIDNKLKISPSMDPTIRELMRQVDAQILNS